MTSLRRSLSSSLGIIWAVIERHVSKSKSMGRPEVIYRHSRAVRITHWVNVLVLLVLLMSGLQIFNAHPALYIGAEIDFRRSDPRDAADACRRRRPRSASPRIFGSTFDTTGVFGLSGDAERRLDAARLSRWITLPGYQRPLPPGRRWHFFFAWLFVINGLLICSAASSAGISAATLCRRPSELRHIGASICEHVRLKFPKGEEAKRYNVLQKLAYLGVISRAAAADAVLTGLTMSPGIDAAFPACSTSSADGRRRARSISSARADRSLRPRACRHGSDLGRLEQPPLDDHRPLRDRAGRTSHEREPRPRPPRLPGARLGCVERRCCSAAATDLSTSRWVARASRFGRALTTRRPARAARRRTTLAREYQRGRHLARLQGQRLDRSRRRRTTRRYAANDFADWKLKVDGLVEQPLEFSLADLRAMPSRTQITRHDCVEGWSCIGKWKGVPLGAAARAGEAQAGGALHRLPLRRRSRRDRLDGRQLLREHRSRRRLPSADHPRLRHERRSRCPSRTARRLRLRVERQLGYKMAKYVMRIEAVDELRRNLRRQRRLLGRPRLRVVRGHLIFWVEHLTSRMSAYGTKQTCSMR